MEVPFSVTENPFSIVEVPFSVTDWVKFVTDDPRDATEVPFSVTSLMTDAASLMANMAQVPFSMAQNSPATPVGPTDAPENSLFQDNLCPGNWNKMRYACNWTVGLVLIISGHEKCKCVN